MKPVQKQGGLKFKNKGLGQKWTKSLKQRAFFGLSVKRVPQWLAAVDEAGGVIGWRDWVAMCWLALKGLRRGDRKRWKQRMRTCATCPVYRATTRQCGAAGSGLGCGCYMPLKAKDGTCWLREQGSTQGWED